MTLNTDDVIDNLKKHVAAEKAAKDAAIEKRWKEEREAKEKQPEKDKTDPG